MEKGLSVAPDHQPRIPRNYSRRPNEAQRRRYLELQKRRDAHAAQLQLDPTLIASRSVLSELAHTAAFAVALHHRVHRILIVIPMAGDLVQIDLAQVNTAFFLQKVTDYFLLRWAQTFKVPAL